LQRQALATQELEERCSFAAKRRAALARVSIEIHEHVGAVLLRHAAMLAAPPKDRNPTHRTGVVRSHNDPYGTDQLLRSSGPQP
jgi:hypothetical protein